jgi:hypothetical protein
MKIKVDAEIKTWEWLALACFVVIIFLIFTGDVEVAIQVLTQWLQVVRK